MSDEAKRAIRRAIAAGGPLSVADYMNIALGAAHGGYYATRDPLGAAGDFITAPEISQMFGEILGLWCAHMWTALGAPAPCGLIELGPGRGTLMADMLRAARLAPGFAEAVRVHLVETSPALIEKQQTTLAREPAEIMWHARIEDVPDGPALVVANEFFDALPVHQYVATETGWCERRIAVDSDDRLAWVEVTPLGRVPVADALWNAPPGTIVEVSPERAAVAARIGERLASAPGAALLIDYGHSGPAAGDSFQALKGHAFVDPLAEPGEADLTSHVDFTALAEAAEGAGASAYGPMPQGEFLLAMGIAVRAGHLRAAHPARAEEIDLALARLVAADQMGLLFKALALASPHLAVPPPFSAVDRTAGSANPPPP